MAAHRRHWLNWGLVPGPVDFNEPFYSTQLHDDIAHYDPAYVAEITLRIPQVQLTHAATPGWWEWRARWTDKGGAHIMLGMTLFDVDPAPFGGFNLDADCSACELLHVWNALRANLPRLWLHSPDCRIYRPESFHAEHVA